MLGGNVSGEGVATLQLVMKSYSMVSLYATSHSSCRIQEFVVHVGRTAVTCIQSTRQQNHSFLYYVMSLEEYEQQGSSNSNGVHVVVCLLKRR